MLLTINPPQQLTRKHPEAKQQIQLTLRRQTPDLLQQPDLKDQVPHTPIFSFSAPELSPPNHYARSTVYASRRSRLCVYVEHVSLVSATSK